MAENEADESAPDCLELVEVALLPSALAVIDQLRDHQSRSDWLANAAVRYACIQAGLEHQYMHEWPRIAAELGKVTRRRLSVGVSLPELEEFAALARLSHTSTSKLGQVALRQFLGQARRGEISMIRESLINVEPEDIKADPKTYNYYGHDDHKRDFMVSQPRVLVGLIPGEFEELAQIAHQWQTSPSRLGQIAIRLVMIQARGGALPMVRPSTAANADTSSQMQGIFDPID